MPYNKVVRAGTYDVSSAMEAAQESALRAVHHLLQPVRELSLAHRRELLTISLWKWTEAAGVAPHAKFNVRYATPAALDQTSPVKVNHEHVWPWKWIIDRLLEPGRTWTEAELRTFLEAHGVACIVTVDEHGKLSSPRCRGTGWERYAEVGLRVRDLTGEGFLDLGRPPAPAVVGELALPDVDLSVALEPGEEATEPSSPGPEITVDEAFDRLSAARAPLLKRLLTTADRSGGVGVVGSTRRADFSTGAYVRVHDATLPEPTRAVAYVHWSGRVSLALSPEDLPDGLTNRDQVATQAHTTYGVSCKVDDETSLATAEELLALALEQVRSEFGPLEEVIKKGIEEDRVPQGHVFVVQGTIGGLGADAAIVSTDEFFTVESSWHGLLGPEQPYDPAESKPERWSDRGWGRDASGRPIWFLDVTEAETGGTDAFGRLASALADIASAGLVSTVRGRQLPLVVLPVIGTGLGGFNRERGTVIDRLLTACRTFVDEHPIDLAIVARSSASFAALQHRRRELVGQYFTGVDLARAEKLGQRAREGSLALFIGAGTSIPAGAPSWDGLINALADEAKLDPQAKEVFGNLGTLDQAELLHAKLRERMGEEIAKRVENLTPALAHVLLANLECQGAVTTNYDRLYEWAVESAGEAAITVLPTQIPSAGNRWLLKLHGDMKDSASIVLTRSQFVAFTEASGPAGAVVQSLLLTKHLLVVGASMNDDNFLRLIYEVGAYRDRVQRATASKDGQSKDDKRAEPQQFGTILSLSDDAARRQLYQPYFSWEAMPGEDDFSRARQLEIFLDAVAMYSSNDHSWLLDERFDYLLQTDERELADRVRALAAAVQQRATTGSAWTVLANRLKQFGARPPTERRSQVKGRTDDSWSDWVSASVE